MFAPKKCNNKAGVTKMPAMLLMTALQMDVATLPPLLDVSMIHIFTVVGKHVIIKSPSTSAGGTILTFDNIFWSGTPMRKGHSAKMAT